MILGKLETESFLEIMHSAVNDSLKDEIAFDIYFGKKLFRKAHLKTWKEAIYYMEANKNYGREKE